MRLVRIAARKSDLARIQALLVARSLKQINPNLEVRCDFRDSLGDRNQSDPLWKMPDKGVFTADFARDLSQDKADLVVHSWKDLPTESSRLTTVAATLPRADSRDLLLCRSDVVQCAQNGELQDGELRVLTSSPRRAHNLADFLQWALPFRVGSTQFLSVRGNVPTRIRKLMSGDGDALIVAKAALDRLLATADWERDVVPNKDFSEVRGELRAALAQCRWMALPLSLNPSAAGQGAIAVEILQSRDDLRALLTPINCPVTFAAVTRERAYLASFGGGCQQKIGVAVLPRPYGDVIYVRGLSDSGQILDSQTLESHSPVPRATSPAALYPTHPLGPGLFERQALAESASEAGTLQARQADALWIARETALLERLQPLPNQFVWCAGLASWRKLAGRGVWVNGCADGLGEAEPPAIDQIAGRTVKWVKLSHADSAAPEAVATYRLVPRAGAGAQDFADKTHFFWMSASAFEQALRLDPTLSERGHHACGPGRSAARIAQLLACDARGERGRFSVCLGLEDWRTSALGTRTKVGG